MLEFRLLGPLEVIADGRPLRLGPPQQRLACQGLAAWASGDYDSGWTLTEQAVAAARRAGDRWHAAMGLAHLGRVSADQGDVERAGALLEESVALAREVGQPMAVGFALDLLATLAYREGRDAPAAALAEQALWAYRAGGSPQELIGSALRTIGLVAFRRGDDERAAAVHLERLTLYRRLGIRGSVAACLEDLADIATGRNQPVQAVRLFAAADAMRSTNGTPLPHPERDHHQRRLAAVRAILDEAATRPMWCAPVSPARQPRCSVAASSGHGRDGSSAGSSSALSASATLSATTAACASPMPSADISSWAPVSSPGATSSAAASDSRRERRSTWRSLRSRRDR
ncbi:MAG: hypothetical protein ACRDST_19760 [Pseudonocardiaceae bacterium]